MLFVSRNSIIIINTRFTCEFIDRDRRHTMVARFGRRLQRLRENDENNFPLHTHTYTHRLSLAITAFPKKKRNNLGFYVAGEIDSIEFATIHAAIRALVIFPSSPL